MNVASLEEYKKSKEYFSSTEKFNIGYETEKALLFVHVDDEERKAWIAKSQTRTESNGSISVRQDMFNQRLKPLLEPPQKVGGK